MQWLPLAEDSLPLTRYDARLKMGQCFTCCFLVRISVEKGQKVSYFFKIEKTIFARQITLKDSDYFKI